MYVGLVHVAIAHQQAENQAEQNIPAEYQPDPITQLLSWLAEIFSIRTAG